MKIVSLLPSATEIVCALGLEEHLCAVTHECDFPPAVQKKPVITSSVLNHELSDSLQIHKGITGLMHEGKSIYHLDEDLLSQIQPDLILTQELCDVCAVSYNIVLDAARVLEGETEVISLEPNLLHDVLDNITLVGEKTGKQEVANRVTETLQNRIAQVVQRAENVTRRPKVYCMEWIDPPFAAGHWISEMVSMAGGRDELALPAQPSEPISWQSVLDFAPEILIFMPCGFDVERSLKEAGKVRNREGWGDLPAVRNGRVYAVDGSSYFNRPGPRLIDGLEILAQIIHPKLFSFHHTPIQVQKVDC